MGRLAPDEGNTSFDDDRRFDAMAHTAQAILELPGADGERVGKWLDTRMQYNMKRFNELIVQEAEDEAKRAATPQAEG